MPLKRVLLDFKIKKIKNFLINNNVQIFQMLRNAISCSIVICSVSSTISIPLGLTFFQNIGLFRRQPAITQ